MKRAITGLVVGFSVGGMLYGQAADDSVTFEVASIKRSPPRQEGAPQGTVGCYGGPGSSDPTRYTCSNASVALMVIEAYGLKPYQIRPSYAQFTRRFHVAAKVPPGTTSAQVKIMLRNLLAERFKLAFHYDKGEAPGYALVIAKGGLKMKESIPDPAAEAATKPAKDADGFVYIPPHNRMAVGWANGMTRWVGNNVPAAFLTGLMNSLTGKPVIDSTGLSGKYDFMLTFGTDTLRASAASAVPSPDGTPTDPPAGGLTVFAALEQQLGLRLEPRKIAFDAFVIEHAEDMPIEN